MIAELISAILENYIYDITSSGIKKWFDKRRRKKFLQSIRKDIAELCGRNECAYVDSSAFDYFIRTSRFVERVIERAISTKLDSSNNVFLKTEIQKAREIAEKEKIEFSKNEEWIIKDLYHIIEEKVAYYYSCKLSPEQRHMVAVYLESITKLQNSVDEFKDRSLANDSAILAAIRNERNLSDTRLSDRHCIHVSNSLKPMYK